MSARPVEQQHDPIVSFEVPVTYVDRDGNPLKETRVVVNVDCRHLADRMLIEAFLGPVERIHARVQYPDGLKRLGCCDE